MGETPERRPLRRYLPQIFFFCLAGLVIHLWALLGAVTFGYSFVPSEAYVSDHDMTAKAVAIAVGCLTFIFCGRKFAKDLKTSGVSAKTLIVSGFGLLVLPFVFGIFIRATVLTAYPFWSAALMGKDTQLEFSVEDTAGSSVRCSHRVDLAGMPMMAGTLCGISDDFRKTLYRGIRVELTGRGTADGLFATRIDAADFRPWASDVPTTARSAVSP